MNNILKLLKEKNLCLQKFYKLNKTELENFNAGVFDCLEGFYDGREGLLQLIKKIDDVIERENSSVVCVEKYNDSERRAIISELSYKNDLVNKILEQDLCILSVIEAAKSKIICELRQVQSAHKVLGRYKPVPNSGRLDEEV